MTIDEAIEHAKEVSKTCDDSQCAADHLQLSEWLRKARGAEKAARWYTAMLHEIEEERDTYRDIVCHMVHPDVCDQLQAENAKLRELVRDMYDNYRVGWNEEIEDDLWNRMCELGIEVDG